MLDSRKKEEYGIEYNAAVLEQWKTCVEQANSNTEKRNNSNGLFITLNVALFAVVTFTWDYKSILLSIVGIIVSILWLKMIQSYRNLSLVKYNIINEMEKQLPLAPLSHEWELLKRNHHYVDLTKIEKFVPWLFIALYSLAILWPVGRFFLDLICPCIAGTTT